MLELTKEWNGQGVKQEEDEWKRDLPEIYTWAGAMTMMEGEEEKTRDGGGKRRNAVMECQESSISCDRRAHQVHRLDPNFFFHGPGRPSGPSWSSS